MLTILIMYYATAFTKNQFQALRQTRCLVWTCEFGRS